MVLNKCELCKKKRKTVQCQGCGRQFCKNCGDQERMLCRDCIEYEENSFERDYVPDLS